MDINFSIVPMFAVPLIVIRIKDFTSKKKKLKAILKSYPEIKSPLNNFKSNKNKTDIKLRVSLYRMLEKELTWAMEELKINLALTDAWSVVYEKGDYSVPHNHGSKGFSAILYLDLHKTSPKTTFIQPWNSTTDKTSLYTPTIEEGDLIIFPQSILHFTEPNKIKFKKRIISFDLTR